MESPKRPRELVLGHLDPKLGVITPGEALRGHAFLSGMDHDRLAALTEIAQPVRLREHDIILAAGQRASDFYLLLSGRVYIELNKGHFVVRIQSLGRGDAFGWSALLEHHDTLFDVCVYEPGVALRLDGGRLSDALKADPILAAELLRRTLQLVAGRVQATEVRLGELCGVRISGPLERPALATILHTLNKLIQVCLDGELGYRTAAERLKHSELSAMLTEYANQRSQFARELGAEVERLGGKPGHSGSMAASFHRGWIALKSAISGGDVGAIIAACETGESTARTDYEHATTTTLLPNETRMIIQAQRNAVNEACEWLRRVHSATARGIQILPLEPDC